MYPKKFGRTVSWKSILMQHLLLASFPSLNVSGVLYVFMYIVTLVLLERLIFDFEEEWFF